MGAPDGSRYIVISADGHVGPPIEDFRPYCPTAFSDDLEEQIRGVQASRAGAGGFAEIAVRAFGYTLDPAVIDAVDRANEITGGWDPVARLADMDDQGIAAEVLFHGLQNGEPMPLVSSGLFQGKTSVVRPEHEAVGCRIYNRWLAAFISTAPERFAGLAAIPIGSMQEAVAEVEWANAAGLRGVNFPAPRPDLPSFTNGYMDPLFEACAALSMPLVTHAGAGARFSYDDGVLGKAFQMMEGSFVARRGVWQLFFSGAFERFPGLRLVPTEVFAQWAPEMVRDMDAAYLDPINPPLRNRLPRLPSEYWNTNCYVGASMMSRDEALLYPARGTAKMMWGSDYPHIEGTYPYTRLALQTTFHGLPEPDVRRLVGETAAELYGFDLSTLRPIADKIGPAPGDLFPEPTVGPRPDYYGFAFRPNTSWPADSVLRS